MKRTAVALGLSLLLLAACGTFTAPVPTPQEMDDVIAELVLHGGSVHNLVSGDAGCPTSDLHDNAIHFDLALGNQSATHEVYLLRWRRQADYDAAAQAFADCVAEYQALHPEQPVSQLESNPWRAYGSGWTPQVEETLRAALQAAGGA